MIFATYIRVCLKNDAASVLYSLNKLQVCIIGVDTEPAFVKFATSEQLSELIVARNARLDTLDDAILALLTSLLYHLRRARDAGALQLPEDGL